MFDEDDLLAISALAHLFFCERRAALIHVEGLWDENVFTAEGRNLHERTHEPTLESRGEVRIARGLRLRSLRLGLTGVADVVEFHRCAEPLGSGGLRSPNVDQRSTLQPPSTAVPAVTDVARPSWPCPVTGGFDFRTPVESTGLQQAETPVPQGFRSGVSLPGARGLWQPFPVEYKRGRLRREEGYEVQLCAQALCLEEMLGAAIPAGAVFYGQPRRRLEVIFSEELRHQTETAAARLHELTRAGKTPVARYEKKCESCSLLNQCMPKTTGARKSVERYLATAMET